MKKIFIPLCILLFSATVNGQIVKSFNIAGGLTWGRATLWDTDSTVAEDYDVQQAWGIEGGVAFFEGKFISMGVQAGYTIKGRQQSSEATINDTLYKSKNKFYKNYLFLAPRFTFHPDFKKLRPYIFISPRLDYLLSARGVQSLNELVVEYKYSKDKLKTSMTDAVFSIAYGGGVELQIDRVGIGLEVQRMMNITPEEKLTGGASYTSIIFLSNLTFRYYLNK